MREAFPRKRPRALGACPSGVFPLVVLVTGQTGENARDVMAMMIYDMSRQYHAERMRIGRPLCRLRGNGIGRSGTTNATARIAA